MGFGLSSSALIAAERVVAACAVKRHPSRVICISARFCGKGAAF